MSDFGAVTWVHRLYTGCTSAFVWSRIAGVVAGCMLFVGASVSAHDLATPELDGVGPVVSTFEEHCAFPMLETWSPDTAALDFQGTHSVELPAYDLTNIVNYMYRHVVGPSVEVAFDNHELLHCKVAFGAVGVEAVAGVFERLKAALGLDLPAVKTFRSPPGFIEELPEVSSTVAVFLAEGTGNFPIEVSIGFFGDKDEGTMTLSASRWPPLGLSLPFN